MGELRVLRPGRRRFSDAYALQRELVERLRADEGAPGFLVLLEHEPVVTFGRNAGTESLRVSREDLARRGIEICPTDRGGDATYHGPGQLVLYAVVRLRALRRSIKDFVCGLEKTMLRLSAAYGVDARRRDGLVGAWVGEKKIGSLGIRVSAGLAFHGLAYNVTTDLDAFRVIHPCGLRGTEMTSLAEQLGRPVPMEEAQVRCLDAFRAVFGVELVFDGFPEAAR
ncbi:MAG: lipoyl(octanoyl) transferase LipB [Planctomycetes bacterium]|nr:lipoyl(octanoyl) transferase LipB [Planctomycetota bacterium]